MQGYVPYWQVSHNCTAAATPGSQTPVYNLANSLYTNFQFPSDSLPPESLYTAAVGTTPALYLYNSTAINLAPALLNALDEVATGSKIIVRNHPFPLSEGAQEKYAAIR